MRTAGHRVSPSLGYQLKDDRDLCPARGQAAGKVAMGDRARRFRLGSDLLLPVVTARLGTLIRGRLEGGLLFTPAYIARVRVWYSMLVM